jgi:prophage regulatory protein
MRLLSYDRLRDKGVPYTREHLARLVKSGKFPPPVSLSNKRIAWVESEVDDWLVQIIANRPAINAPAN